jgi:hypothetical protein
LDSKFLLANALSGLSSTHFASPNSVSSSFDAIPISYLCKVSDIGFIARTHSVLHTSFTFASSLSESPLEALIKWELIIVIYAASINLSGWLLDMSEDTLMLKNVNSHIL